MTCHRGTCTRPLANPYVLCSVFCTLTKTRAKTRLTSKSVTHFFPSALRRFLSSLKHTGQPRVGTILPACHRADGNARHPPVVDKTPLASAASESLHSVVSVYNRLAGRPVLTGCVFSLRRFRGGGGERKCFRREAHNKACELSCVTEL